MTISHIYDAFTKSSWCYMKPSPIQCFNPRLLMDLNRWCELMAQGDDDTKYHVLTSDGKEFNLGGDLGLFSKMVRIQDRQGLLEYATDCIRALYANISHFGRDITTISLVNGDALGGGLEAALSSDVVIAEKGVKMGFPEILFNLFPGMGALSLLSRRIGYSKAERIILSGKIYTAEELYDEGVIDILAERGYGVASVHSYIKKENRAMNGYRAVRSLKNTVTQPITYTELDSIANKWVETALNLSNRDLAKMDRIVNKQSVT